jgi:hypothetical protein
VAPGSSAHGEDRDGCDLVFRQVVPVEAARPSRWSALDHFVGGEDQVDTKVVLGLRQWLVDELHRVHSLHDDRCGADQPGLLEQCNLDVRVTRVLAQSGTVPVHGHAAAHRDADRLHLFHADIRGSGTRCLRWANEVGVKLICQTSAEVCSQPLSTAGHEICLSRSGDQDMLASKTSPAIVRSALSPCRPSEPSMTKAVPPSRRHGSKISFPAGASQAERRSGTRKFSG